MPKMTKQCKECECTHCEDEHFKILLDANDISRSHGMFQRGPLVDVKFKAGDCKICGCIMYHRRK